MTNGILKKMNLNGFDIEGQTQGSLAVSGTAAQTAALAEGLYDVWCAAIVYVKVGQTADDVTTSNGLQIPANEHRQLFVRNGSKIGGILASSTSSLKYHKIA